MIEEWKPISGFPYEVSNLENVRRIETFRSIKPDLIRNRNGNLYAKVRLTRFGIQHKRFVHRLVAQAFIPNPENRPEVNHWDENTLNNIVSNLEWSTRRENEMHKVFMRLTRSSKVSAYADTQ